MFSGGGGGDTVEATPINLDNTVTVEILAGASLAFETEILNYAEGGAAWTDGTWLLVGESRPFSNLTGDVEGDGVALLDTRPGRIELDVFGRQLEGFGPTHESIVAERLWRAGTLALAIADDAVLRRTDGMTLFETTTGDLRDALAASSSTPTGAATSTTTASSTSTTSSRSSSL